jgi:hypothetical protein
MLQAGFILLTITLAIILLWGTSRIANKAFTDGRQQKRFKIKTALTLIIWLTYVSLISLSGIFTIAALPPRIPLLLVLPAFVFFIYFFASRQFKAFIAHTPASWPVYFQSFRIIVELLIWGAFLNGILPKEASFEGYNFDIAIGITAPFIGYFIVAKGGSKNTGALLAWNFIGLITLVIVVFILMSRSYFYCSFGLSESILARGLGVFPYTFLAGFFMPLAVFMHIYSIIKTRQHN